MTDVGHTRYANKTLGIEQTGVRLKSPELVYILVQYCIVGQGFKTSDFFLHTYGIFIL